MPVDPIQPDAAHAHHAVGRAELLCLLRLHGIALGDPAPVAGLRAMVDEIARVPDIIRALVAVPTGAKGRLRFLAHVGRPHLEPHAPVVQQATPMAAQAMATGELVQITRSDGGGPHVCLNLPIRGADQVIGFFGLGARCLQPLEPWREQFAWACAELVALPLVGADLPGTGAVAAVDPLARLTPRQRDVLLTLADGGASNAEIGDRLGVSALTVKVHLLAAYRLLGVTRRADALRKLLTEHADWLAQARRAAAVREAAG